MLVLSRMEESPEDPQVGSGSRVSAGFVPWGKFCCSRLRIKTDNLIHVCFSFPQRLPCPPTMKRCLISLKIREMQGKYCFLPTRLTKMKKFNELWIPWCEHGKTCCQWENKPVQPSQRDLGYELSSVNAKPLTQQCQQQEFI